MDVPKLSSRRQRTLFALLSALLVSGVVFLGVFYYRHDRSAYETELTNQLSSVAELKVAELARFRSERLADATVLFGNSSFTELAIRFLTNPEDGAARETLTIWFARFQEAYKYDAVMLHDATLRKVLVVPAHEERPVSWVSGETMALLRAGKIAFEDFYFNDKNQAVCLKTMVPIMDPKDPARLLGVVAFRIDPSRYLYPLLQRWPTASRTAETLLVRRDGDQALFLNELRFKSDTALKLRVPLTRTDVLAVKAILNTEGPVEGVDYRGEPALGVVLKVPDAPWYLVAKMDLAEVHAPLAEHLNLISMVVFVILLALASILLLVWRWRSARVFREQYQMERALRQKEEIYKALYENVGVGVALISPEFSVLAVNKRMQQWFPGVDQSRMSFCYQSINFVPLDAPCADCPVAFTFKDGLLHEGEVSKESPSGTRHYRIISTPIRDPDGRLTAAIEMVDDVTERRQMEESLRESESRLRAITDSAGEAIIMIDGRGAVTFWNPAAEAIFRYPESEVLGRNLHELIAPARYHDAHRKAFSEFVVTGRGAAIGKTLELQAQRRTGDEITVALSLTAIKIHEQWHAVGIMRDVTLEKQAERALKESTDRANAMAFEAQAANIAKGQFLANMSHEIRTPMNGIIGMTGLLLDTELTEEQRRFAEVVRSSGEALMSVINDILDFSKIEADKLDLEELDFDLRAMLEDAAELLAVRAHEKHLEFICQVDPELHTFVRGDPGRLRQILVNLVGNAIKFTSVGEVGIYVKLEKEEARQMLVRFEVRDTGIGIPKDKFGLLFHAFEQVDASTTRRFGGTGLGLAISKRLAELMGGAIGVESIEGKGSTFWFTAVLGRAEAAEPLVDETRADISGARVLVVDDNATNRLVMAQQLASWSVRHQEAEGAAEAMQLLREAQQAGDPFKIVLTDMQMPDIDGETLGTMIKADPRLRDTHLVMMTSLGRRGDAKRLRQMGFSAYLTKPVRQSQLFDCLATVLGEVVPVAKSQEPGALVTRHSLSESRRKRIRVLLAEDNPTNQQVAMQILAKLGYKADAVGNGLEALDALAKTAYDLVFMDVQMPIMDGFEATRLIRAGRHNVPNPAVPVVAMTAHSMKGDREKCLDAGMDDYISKPIAPQDLARTLEKWLGPGRKRPAAPAAPQVDPDDPDAPVVFDREALFARLMGDEDLLVEILRGFVMDMATQLGTLRSQVEGQLLEATNRQAHTIKGAAANVGAMAMSDAALRIERAAAAGQAETLADLMTTLETQFSLLKARVTEDPQ